MPENKLDKSQSNLFPTQYDFSIMKQGKVDARENGFSHMEVELGWKRDFIGLSTLPKPTHC